MKKPTETNEINETYDILIIGAGPAGLTAGQYGARGGLKVLIIEKGQIGGQLAESSGVENYPGQPLGVETGISLTTRMAEQAEKFGANVIRDEIESVALKSDIKILTGKSSIYQGKTVIIAAGARPRPIGCTNEERYRGRGISYCAVCDAPFYRGLEVYVAGGGDSAIEEAIYLTKYARKVTVIHRRDRLRAMETLQRKAYANPKIEFLWNSVIERVDGDDALNFMLIRNVKTGEFTEIRADAKDGLFGLFGFTGHEPDTKIYEGELDMECGYIVTNNNMETNIIGVYAAGDVRQKLLRQAVTAASDGAIAASQATEYVSRVTGSSR